MPLLLRRYSGETSFRKGAERVFLREALLRYMRELVKSASVRSPSSAKPSRH